MSWVNECSTIVLLYHGETNLTRATQSVVYALA